MHTKKGAGTSSMNNQMIIVEILQNVFLFEINGDTL